MKTAIYEWIKNIVFYQLVVSIVINMIPDNAYQKYVRFFLGMLFLVIVIQPIFQLMNMTESIDGRYMQEMWEKDLEENSIEFDMGERQKSDGKVENSKYGVEEG